MENKIEVFQNEQFGAVRITLIDGEPWFAASDVCKALEIKNAPQALSRLEEDERFTTIISTPPKQYTEDTLLSAMETAGNEAFDDDTEKKGLGTPATRAGIIEKLVKGGYAERKGKSIVPTKDGMNLVCVLPEQICGQAMSTRRSKKCGSCMTPSRKNRNG